MAPVFSKKIYIYDLNDEGFLVKLARAFTNFLKHKSEEQKISEYADYIYEAIISKFDKKFPITAVYKQINETGHSFSIIGKASVSTNKLLKLYNPWQSEINFPWNSWNDASKNMTKYKDYLGHTIGNDGIFYIDIKDFIQHFKSISWVEVYPEYVIDYFDIAVKKMNLTSGIFSAHISVKIKNVSEELPLYLFIDLPNKKFLRDCEILYEFKSLKAESSNGKSIPSCNDSESTLMLTQDDTYDIYVEIFNPVSFEPNTYTTVTAVNL